MYINSFLFIFVFLPLVLAAYYLSGRYRNIVLSCFDIVFFLLNALEYTFIFVLFLVFNIAAGRLIGRAREGSTARKLLFAAGITADALILVIGKLPETTVIPLGLSFLVFKAISYLSDVYLKRIELDGDQFRDLVYLSFFGQLQSGPIARYKDMEFRGRDMSLICGGAYRFVIGFSKKVLLADVLGKITAEVFSADPASVSMSYAWLGAVCWALELFYDFAGYSDMAIGISNMFGFECPENFIYPYTSESISKFWRKWHITLGAWFRDYIYIPLGGSRCSRKWRVYVNLFTVWLLTGLWHGTTLNFILWGLIYFALIAFERLTGLPDRLKRRPARIAYRVFVLAAVLLLWVIFRCEDVTAAARFIGNMFVPGSGLPEYDIRTVYLLKHNLVFIAFAVLFSTPAVPALKKKLAGVRDAALVRDIAVPIAAAALFLISVSFVMSGINDPFAYANF